MDKTGGPAFPAVGFEPEHDGDCKCGLCHEAGSYLMHEGVTVRDFFAGMALKGLLANTEHFNFVVAKNGNKSYDIFSDESYGFAESMLKTREKL